MITKCNECIFLKEGCELGRHSVFNKFEDDQGIYVDRFCNAKRKDDWKEGKDDYIARVYDEIYTKVDVVVTDNYQECLDSLPTDKVNHIFFVGSTSDVFRVEHKKSSSFQFFDVDPIIQIIPKLSGEYVLIIDKPFTKNFESINKRINLDLEKVAYIKDPILLNKALLTIASIGRNSFKEVIDFLDEKLEEKNIKSW